MNLALKATPLTKRIREVNRELSRVDDSIRDLAKVVEGERPGVAAPRLPPLIDPIVSDRAPTVRQPDVFTPEPVRLPRDGRFADYLATSIDRPSQPLRHERSVQRNKAILTMCLVLLVLFWILHRWLL